jgi:hypothetical protein
MPCDGGSKQGSWHLHLALGGRGDCPPIHGDDRADLGFSLGPLAVGDDEDMAHPAGDFEGLGLWTILIGCAEEETRACGGRDGSMLIKDGTFITHNPLR